MSSTNADKIDKLLGGNSSLKKETKSKKSDLIQMSYYITTDMRKAIALRAATDDIDKSAVVRAALSAYLGV